MDLAERVLCYMDENSGLVDSLELAKVFGEDHQKIVGAIKSLQSHGGLIDVEQRTTTEWELTQEGQSIVAEGSHEARFFEAVEKGEEGSVADSICSLLGPSGKIGMSKAVKSGWIKIKKDASGTRVIRNVENITDTVRNDLRALSEGKGKELSDINEYKKRKLIQQVSIKFYKISKGSKFATSFEKPETDLTPELLSSGDWKTKVFKNYNFNALGIPISTGHLHPLLKVRSEFRQIFLEMGFSEMPTNRFIESSFWNFDSLFQPQQHPARDAHDTFFLSRPQKSKNLQGPYLERVKKVHSQGDYGSIGYGYDWKIEEAEKNVLRTHTTAVSARMLHALGQEAVFRPTKLFSIDRVFRNETLDATHLAEFHQVEGVVADRNITLGHLLGTIKQFFKRLGIEKIRFKPAYNPYTEPSMEVFAYHPGLKKWVEVGNSGMFRPEMLLPMNLPEDVNVIAWGLSLERPTMIRYGIDNIRDLVGHKVDLQMVYNNPLCRLDKH